MNFAFDVARRYLFGKKSTNAINIISGVSIAGITIGTIALILILSVFNGFEDIIRSSLDAFNPDLKVIPQEGKTFKMDESTFEGLVNIEGIENVSKTITEVAVFEYRNDREVGILKGVDEFYNQVTSIDSTIKEGVFQLKDDQKTFAVCERVLASKLGINILDPLSQLTVHVPKKKKSGPLGKDFKSKEIIPVGVFAFNNTSDQQYIISSFELVNKLLESKNNCSALEIKLAPEADEKSVKNQIHKVLGEGFIIKNRIEQDATHLKIMQIEKWVSFVIICFVIFIIVFNLIGSLWMIVLDKKKDIMILKFMGYDRMGIRNIFLSLGFLITLIGILLGVLISLIVIYIQINYGLIAMLDGYRVQYYPVKVLLSDIIIIVTAILSLGILASILPANKAAALNHDLH